MKTWFTADLHLSHKRIIDLCERPFGSTDEMDQAIIEGINSRVSDQERLVILGDICMGKLDTSLPLLAQIKAKDVVLVPGNHDRWSPAYQHRGDAAAKREAFRIRYEGARPGIRALPGSWDESEGFCDLCAHDPAPRTFWDFADLYPPKEWRDCNPLEEAVFSHFPYEGDSQGSDRYENLRPDNNGYPLIHGHVHNAWKIKDNQFNVGVDVNNFLPVSEDEIGDWISTL